jgi:AmiR/NasT family two-component response regulator
VALAQFEALRMRDRYVERLEQKQAKIRVIQQATQLVMETRGVSEERAYQLLRSKAMLKREQIEVVAREIVKAHEALTF